MSLFLLGMGGMAGGSAVNSNSIVEDGIEYYIQTDKAVYDSGETVEMLYRVTNLGDEDVTFGFTAGPVNDRGDFIVEENGESIWDNLRRPRDRALTQFTLSPLEFRDFTHLWDMTDSGGHQVTPGNYDVTGALGNLRLAYMDKYIPVSVPIQIIPEPAMIYYADADAAGANNGSSWGDAFNDLQDALVTAQYGDEIRVAEGIYKPAGQRPPPPPPPMGSSSSQDAEVTALDREATFQLINGVAIKGGYAGFGEPNPNVRDIEVYETVLSGDLNGNDGPDFANNAENSYHVVTGSGTDANTVLDGFTITAGNANGSGWWPEDPRKRGGGMYNNSGSPTVTNCTFTGNSADFGGGGMHNEDDSSPTVTNCAFTGNSAGRGGGMCNEARSSPTLTNCTFSSNSSQFEGGGAMANFWDSTPMLTNCTFSGNAAKNGGGMYNYYSQPVLTNCTFAENSAETGGGMNNYVSSPTLTNCRFSSNSANLGGGGMYNDWNSIATLTNCTFADNSASLTGGVFGVSPEMLISNCIFWGNRDRDGMSQKAQIWPTWQQNIIYSCIQGWSGDPPGIGNIGADPCLVEPGYWADVNDPNIVLEPDDANAIWIDGDYHLLPISPCIDAGDNVAVELTTDLDGNRRIVNGIVDMGAFEHQGPRQTRQFYVDDDATGANNGSSWADAYNYLQDAPAAAWRGDEIRVAQGVYKPDQGAGITPGDRTNTFQLKHGVIVKGGYSGTGSPDPNERDTELYESILSGDIGISGDNSDNSYHVVTGSGCEPTAVLDGFTITAGNANGLPWESRDKGGGMYNRGGSPTVTNCTFISNSADHWGGGMHNEEDSDPDVTNCTFRGNEADNGGGMCNWGGGMHSEEGSSPTLTNCTFSGNHAIMRGGGICNSWNGRPTLINCTFAANSATRGNALACDWGSPKKVQVTNCIIWDGENAIWYRDRWTVIVAYSVFQGGWPGEGNIDADPCFVDAANGDYHLQPDSPCIDTGDNNSVPVDWADLDGDGDTNEPIPFDLDGNSRIYDGNNDGIPVVDMGAYEYFDTPPVADAGPDRTVEAEAPWGAKVTLDGSCSSDADSAPGTNDDIVSFDWYKVDACDPNFEDFLASGEIIDCNLPFGEHIIVLEVIDKAGAFDTNEVTIIVQDTTPPVITLNGPATMTLECGVDSYAEEGATATDICDSNVPVVIGGDTVDTSGCGTYVVTYDATDASGNAAERVTRAVVVQDTIPPEFALSVTPTTLWPVNHKMVLITPSWTASDICDASPEVSLLSITTNEADEAKGDGHTAGDIQIGDDGSIYLRAERSGTGSGRIYTITYQAVDDSGNAAVARATVTVPHDQR